MSVFRIAISHIAKSGFDSRYRTHVLTFFSSGREPQGRIIEAGGQAQILQ